MSVCVQDTDQFCRQTLCDADFLQYVNSTFLCWGGDIRKSDPFMVGASSLYALHKLQQTRLCIYIRHVWHSWSPHPNCSVFETPFCYAVSLAHNVGFCCLAEVVCACAVSHVYAYKEGGRTRPGLRMGYQ